MFFWQILVCYSISTFINNSYQSVTTIIIHCTTYKLIRRCSRRHRVPFFGVGGGRMRPLWFTIILVTVFLLHQKEMLVNKWFSKDCCVKKSDRAFSIFQIYSQTNLAGVFSPSRAIKSKLLVWPTSRSGRIQAFCIIFRNIRSPHPLLLIQIEILVWF